MAQQIPGVRGQANGVAPPIGQSVQGANAQTAETGGVSAFGSFQPPVEIAFRPRRVHFGVHGAVVGFLINDQAVGAGLHQRAVVLGFHRPKLQREAGHLGVQRANAIGQVLAGDKLGMLARDQQEVAEALFRKARPSRSTSSTLRVTRMMGLSREKPQYLQLLMHSLER